MSNTPIVPCDTPDPWIILHNSTYYLTFTLGDRIEIWSSQSLEDFHSARKSLVWQPPPSEHWALDLWAPELHHLNGVWYVYFCAAPRNVGNPGHRTVLLRSQSSDPMDAGAWTFLGPLKGLPDDQWSIDATVFDVPDPATGAQRLYCCYSGWPLGDHSDTQQDLFLVRLESPEVAVSTSLTCISRATLPWERPDGGKRGVNEGPTFLNLPPSPWNGGRGFQGIIFSAHGSWGPEYKLGILALVDATEPCRESSWIKRPVPLLVSDESRGPPFGPGHASFVPDGNESVFCIYHGTERPDEGWANRKARVVRLHAACFTPEALPVCCAVGLLGGEGGGMGWTDTGNLPADMGPGLMTGSGGPANVQNASGKGGKIWDEVEKKIPQQYKGYLDKVKKFF